MTYQVSHTGAPGDHPLFSTSVQKSRLLPFSERGILKRLYLIFFVSLLLKKHIFFMSMHL